MIIGEVPIFGGHFGCHLVFINVGHIGGHFCVNSSHLGFVAVGHLGSHVGSDGSHLGFNPSAILDSGIRAAGELILQKIKSQAAAQPSKIENTFSEFNSELFLLGSGLAQFNFPRIWN